MLRRYSRILLFGSGSGLLLALVLALLGHIQPALSKNLAGPLPQETLPPVQESIGNDTCLECHGKPGLTLELDSGETLNLYVDPRVYHDSIHGEKGYACVQCHTRVGNYPHPPFSAVDLRDASLQLYQACKRCHLSQYSLTQDSVHANALASGNRQAAICTDCHTAHAVRQLVDQESGKLLPDAHEWVPQTCAKCHNAIYQKYLTSVHGSALIGEGNPDVPTCIDCHGVHNIENPTTAQFRLRSPEICAKCHTDPQIMDKYGISTDVLQTYIADFHGTTVTLFQKEHPDQQTNKPVCYDCHGVHDIKPVNDPQEGLRIRENLLARCRVCHPDASANFPDAWLSHYIPSPEKNSLVYFVNLFYSIFIPSLLGGMAILVVLDISGVLRSWIKRLKTRFERVTPEDSASGSVGKRAASPTQIGGTDPPSQPAAPAPQAPVQPPDSRDEEPGQENTGSSPHDSKHGDNDEEAANG
ncbi:MAG: cytochrome c3 family protein [Anaerolineales bacterium]|jgi:hypothetical protein